MISAQRWQAQRDRRRALEIFEGLKLIIPYCEKSKEIINELEDLIKHDIFFVRRLGQDLDRALDDLMRQLIFNLDGIRQLILESQINKPSITLREILILDPKMCEIFLTKTKEIIQLSKAGIPIKDLIAMQDCFKYNLLFAYPKNVIFLINVIGIPKKDLLGFHLSLLTELIIYLPAMIQLNISWKHLLSLDISVRYILYRFSEDVNRLVTEEGVMTFGQIEHFLNEKIPWLKLVYQDFDLSQTDKKLEQFKIQLRQFFESPETEKAQSFLDYRPGP